MPALELRIRLAMDPQAVLNLEIPRSHRTLAGHVFAAGVYVFIFGALAYLTFLAQGGLPGQLLLIYVSAAPFAIAIGAVVEIARARQKLEAHHAIAGCLSAILLCFGGGVLLAFRDQIILTLLGSAAVVWLTKYSPAASFLRPPSLSDVTAPAPVQEHRTARTLATIGGALVLFIGGVGLTGLAVISQAERPGGLNITIGG